MTHNNSPFPDQSPAARRARIEQRLTFWRKAYVAERDNTECNPALLAQIEAHGKQLAANLERLRKDTDDTSR